MGGELCTVRATLPTNELDEYTMRTEHTHTPLHMAICNAFVLGCYTVHV